MEQYNGDIEKFLLDLGDATKVTGVICDNFDAVELYGLRELMVNFDYGRIAEFERKWKARISERTSIARKAEGRRDLTLVGPSHNLPKA